MSNEISITTLILEIAISDIILLYAAYISFVVRRGLTVPLYRSRALWLGTSAILWGVFFIFFDNINAAYALFGSYHLVAGTVFYVAIFLLTVFAFFVWIDRTVDTLIRLDFRRKNILGWKKVRPLYWLCAVLGFIFYIFSTEYYVFSVVNYITTFSVTASSVPFLSIALAYALCAIIVGSIRTHDLTFRSHVKWFGLSVATLLLLFVRDIVVLPNIPVLNALPYIFFAYFYYRMARSLVPVNKLRLNQPLQ